MSLSFPLKLEDISLWLAIIAIILLVTLEVLPSNNRKTTIPINRKRLGNAAVAVSIIFLITIFITIIRMISGT